MRKAQVEKMLSENRVQTATLLTEHSRIGKLSVGGVGTTRLPRYAKWLQLERRLVSEVVGVGCEIHKTQMYPMTC